MPCPWLWAWLSWPFHTVAQEAGCHHGGAETAPTIRPNGTTSDAKAAVPLESGPGEPAMEQRMPMAPSSARLILAARSTARKAGPRSAWNLRGAGCVLA